MYFETDIIAVAVLPIGRLYIDVNQENYYQSLIRMS